MERCQRTFHLFAPGCRTNRAEGEAFAALLVRAGWIRASSAAGCAVAVVAGCVVTARAERDARRYILRARREAPGVKVAAVGCLAGRMANFPEGAPPVDLAVPLEARSRLPDLMEGLLEGRTVSRTDQDARFFFVPTLKMEGRTRYFFKIQDGCDAACAYCFVRVVRGGVNSLPPGPLLEHAARLLESGTREIVLCGTHLGAWGRDLGGGADLPGLVRALDALPGDWRWRLSSLEPWDLTDPLLDALAGARRFCRFFHVPLQSGSDRVLAAMARPTRPRDAADLLHRLKARFPAARIGTDVIAGFPGETEAEARETLDFLEAAPLDYLHVFPFSPRPHRPDLVPAAPAVISARAAALKALDRKRREADRERRRGARSEAVTTPRGGILEENLPCRFDAPLPAGRLVPVRITGWEGATARVEIEV